MPAPPTHTLALPSRLQSPQGYSSMPLLPSGFHDCFNLDKTALVSGALFAAFYEGRSRFDGRFRLSLGTLDPEITYTHRIRVGLDRHKKADSKQKGWERRMNKAWSTGKAHEGLNMERQLSAAQGPSAHKGAIRKHLRIRVRTWFTLSCFEHPPPWIQT